MLAKKVLPASSIRTYRKELEYLYARRSSVDALIESLEQYDRCRGTRVEDKRQRKTG
jgi:hypothetical protein